MKIKKIYLITRWSKDNNADYYKGQLVRVYTDDFRSAGATKILTGVIVSDETAIVFSEKSVEDITRFFNDPHSITEEEKDCLKMNYPELGIKFGGENEVCQDYTPE